MTHVHLATALVRRGGAVLLVASRYPNHAHALWNLPGGRQQPGELLAQTALRELREETALSGEVRELCYVSESYDGDTHFINFTFSVDARGEPEKPYVEGDHVVESAWISESALADRIAVAVVREPLLAYLNGTLPRYAGYAEAGITVEFPD
ncbi:MAG TPA: NUDIX domain-containing protein [Candidatus Baltobacteraceae bacterium]|jgi:ADP-ribose pyrophosphatase YjhB (NUDIX family)|nr:NUDIX domain-containing protein [Candidatus Baltobacteraceae bacterium]